MMAKKEKQDAIGKELDEQFPITGISEEEKKIAMEAGIELGSPGMPSLNDPTTTEEAYAKMMGNLVLDKSDRRKLMSDLSARDVHLFSVSYARADIFKNDVLTKFLDEELMLRVSKKRLGRVEIIKLSGALREQEMKKSWWRRLGGMGGPMNSMGGGI